MVLLLLLAQRALRPTLYYLPPHKTSHSSAVRHPLALVPTCRKTVIVKFPTLSSIELSVYLNVIRPAPRS